MVQVRRRTEVTPVCLGAWSKCNCAIQRHRAKSGRTSAEKDKLVGIKSVLRGGNPVLCFAQKLAVRFGCFCIPLRADHGGTLAIPLTI
jgi:hypothetical protein